MTTKEISEDLKVNLRNLREMTTKEISTESIWKVCQSLMDQLTTKEISEDLKVNLRNLREMTTKEISKESIWKACQSLKDQLTTREISTELTWKVSLPLIYLMTTKEIFLLNQLQMSENEIK